MYKITTSVPNRLNIKLYYFMLYKMIVVLYIKGSITAVSCFMYIVICCYHLFKGIKIQSQFLIFV